MNRIISVIITILLTYTAAFSQKSSSEIKGDEYFNKYNLDKAIKQYSATDELTTQGTRNLAEAYKMINELGQARLCYKKLAESANATPNDLYNVAGVLLMEGNKEEAKGWLNRFAERYPEDSRAKEFKSNPRLLDELLANPDPSFAINNLQMNTENQDFGVAFIDDKHVVFTSTNQGIRLAKRPYNLNDLPFLDVYQARVKNGGELISIEVFGEEYNGKYHEGPASFTGNGGMVAITRNEYTTENEEGKKVLKLYYTNKKGRKWGNLYAFPFNSNSYSVSHPTWNFYGTELIFASDMPGGFGGTDLYRSVRDSLGVWSVPQNLGPDINTPGDEMFPSLHRSGMLFFASDGHIGLGGLDVFRTTYSEGIVGSDIINLGYPINSNADDFAFTINSNLTEGFFSSNRKEGKGDDDIYSFKSLKPFAGLLVVKGKVRGEDGLHVPNALVEVYDASGKVLLTQETNGSGEFYLTVPVKDANKVKASMPNKGEGVVELNSELAKDVFDQDIVLLPVVKPEPELVVEEVKPVVIKEIEVGADLKEVLDLEPIYFDVGSSNIRSESHVMLNKVVEALKANPTMNIEVKAHTDCTGSYVLNMKLSEDRAAEVTAYLKSSLGGSDRVMGKGYGPTQPKEDCSCATKNCTAQQLQLNRRVEFIVKSK